MPSVHVKFKSQTINIEINFDHTVQLIFEYLSEVIEINRLHCRLIVGGKSYLPDSDASLTTPIGDLVKPNATVLLLSSPAADVEKVLKFKSDPLVKGFEAEEKDELRRIQRAQELANANPWSNEQHSEFRFARFEALYRRTKPTPFEAEKLLKKLATDPGITKIMIARRFAVGTLCELDPQDADIEQAQKGESDKCLLGWNRNSGERIALRLRTDDFQSFRKYDSIINTLLHELVHNVVGPHNDQFWALFNELKEEYASVHRSRKGARLLNDSGAAPVRQLGPDDLSSVTAPKSSGGKLGGSRVASDPDEVRAARLRRLEARGAEK